MTNHANPSQVRLLNVALLTALALVAAVAMIATVQGGFALIAGRYPELAMTGGPGVAGFALLAVAEGAYFWFGVRLAGRAAGRSAAVRYAFLLQLQALVEAALFAVYAALATAGIYFLTGALGDLDTQASMWAAVGSGSTALAMFVVGLMLPGVSMLAGSLRMHALSHTPGALAGAIDGSLARKDLVLAADASDARIALVRHLEHLTDKDMPGLGRILYGSHPRLSSRDADGHTVHELVWWLCPMKLLVSMRQLDDGRQQVQVRCVLRGGIHRLELVATPADTLAQMQYIEAHLLAPLGAQLARVSAERERDALHRQAVESQLRILQAQIEPHFLFNTLANVRQLYRSRVVSGEHMMDHLIAYLQCAMDDLRAEESTVVKEMDLAMHYLSIMKIRMGQRLSYSFALPDALLQHPFPPAMLISLVENAIKHGLADCDNGAVELCAEPAGSQLRVTVADNGAGFSSVGGTGVGLANIRQRLEAMYGSRAWLEVGAAQEGGFTATIVIPLDERM